MNATHDLTVLSHESLVAVKRGERSDTHQSLIADLDESRLVALDDKSRAATAFWINLYNAYVQRHLAADPSLYEHNGVFLATNASSLPVRNSVSTTSNTGYCGRHSGSMAWDTFPDSS